MKSSQKNHNTYLQLFFNTITTLSRHLFSLGMSLRCPKSVHITM